MNNQRLGFILAAGYGTRLAPVTDHVPKPMLPLGNQPLLGHIIDRFDEAGIFSIGINSHHLPEIIESYVNERADSSRFFISRESEILGTGGALNNAAGFLENSDYFIIHNADVLCDVDLSALAVEHERSGALATLLLTDWPDVNTVELGANANILSITGNSDEPSKNATSRQLTYTGIGVFSRQLLADIGPGFSSLITPLIGHIKTNPGSVRGYAPDNLFWNDLGTLPRYLQVLLDRYEGQDNQTDAMQLSQITGHGSDRKFWRISSANWSAVAMKSPAEDEEFDRFIEIGKFLSQHKLGPAEFLAIDIPQKTVLMENLGEVSLHALANDLETDPQRVESCYISVVDHLVKLQAATDVARQECASAVDRCLDYEMLRWETGYFLEYYLRGHLNLRDQLDQQRDLLKSLDAEFHQLATAAQQQPLVIVHRDFQSQNILINNNQVRLVDFQGLRLGPLTYDLVSLLFDAYVDLPETLQERLLVQFVAHSGYSRADIDFMVLATGLQRVMQALGAFGFLGHVKGKWGFLAHIPRAHAKLVHLVSELDRLSGQGETDNNLWLPPKMPTLKKVLEAVC